MILTYGDVHIQIAAFEPLDQIVDFLLWDTRSFNTATILLHLLLNNEGMQGKPRMSLLFPTEQLPAGSGGYVCVVRIPYYYMPGCIGHALYTVPYP